MICWFSNQAANFALALISQRAARTALDSWVRLLGFVQLSLLGTILRIYGQLDIVFLMQIDLGLVIAHDNADVSRERVRTTHDRFLYKLQVCMPMCLGNIELLGPPRVKYFSFFP